MVNHFRSMHGKCDRSARWWYPSWMPCFQKVTHRLGCGVLGCALLYITVIVIWGGRGREAGSETKIWSDVEAERGQCLVILW